VNRLAGRLVAPSPGWTRTADVVVVGSGVAGLAAVLHARSAGLSVMVVTKALLDNGSTRWAQGGIAAALGPEDDPEQHLRDTLTAGVGICDEAAVRLLVTEGPTRVRELAALGAAFDRAAGSGDFALTREGGHSRNRVVHAGGDATGLEVERALIAAVRADPEVEVIEHALVLDLLRAPAACGGPAQVAGLTLHVLGEGSRDGVGAVLARAVILATGGLGQIFASTTNPPVSTGDGVALALRAGAEVADLEFVQFHPTALWLGGAAHGQQPLVSEAVRGEGAVLIDASGARVMPEDGHPLRDLAPRDVVTKQMSRVMSRTGTDHLFLDARALGADVLLARFPTIVATCRSHGIDPVVDPIPVTPAAHYASGGVRTDANGQVAGPSGPIPGFYACGEVACTGVHGANRLASNSLLEGLVFAARIARALPATIPERRDPQSPTDPGGARGVLPAGTLRDLTTTMTDGAGVLRGAASLEAAAKSLQELGRRPNSPSATASTETWEATNAHLVASALVAAATVRRETRGCHWREDFPDADEAFRGHLITHLTADGALSTGYRPVAS
jgi:L-aspartate oxidase